MSQFSIALTQHNDAPGAPMLAPAGDTGGITVGVISSHDASAPQTGRRLLGQVSDEGEDEEATARLLEGSVLADKWRVDELLGIGGMAAVYSATHRNGHRAALKVLHKNLSRIPGIRQRFLQESYTANRIMHPGVVTIHDDCVLADGTIFLIMDLLEGETLEALHYRRGCSELEALRVADQVLDVLAAAHQLGIVHRDIKPGNIFVTVSGEIKLLDFGIAYHAESVDPNDIGTTVGTPAFMPPEQALSCEEGLDGRCDLWALGATLYFLMTGNCVRRSGPLAEELIAAMTEPAQPIRSVAPRISATAAQIVDKALAFAKDDRFLDARAMQARVREALVSIARINADQPLAGLKDPTSRSVSNPGPAAAILEPQAATRRAVEAESRRVVRRQLAPAGLGVAAFLATVALFSASDLTEWSSAASWARAAYDRTSAALPHIEFARPLAAWFSIGTDADARTARPSSENLHLNAPDVASSPVSFSPSVLHPVVGSGSAVPESESATFSPPGARLVEAVTDEPGFNAGEEIPAHNEDIGVIAGVNLAASSVAASGHQSGELPARTKAEPKDDWGAEGSPPAPLAQELSGQKSSLQQLIADQRKATRTARPRTSKSQAGVRVPLKDKITDRQVQPQYVASERLTGSGLERDPLSRRK